MTSCLLPISPDLWNTWDDLNGEWADNHPLLQARLIQLLAHHFPKQQLEVLLVEQNQRPRAMLLLKKHAGTLPVTRRGYLPVQSQIAFAQAAPDCSHLQHELFQALPLFTQRLDILLTDSRYHAPLIQQPGVDAVLKGTDMEICLDGTFESYWRDRPRTLKKNISRYHNRIERELDTALVLKVITEPVAVMEAVDRYGLLESQGWKGSNGTALHPDNRQGAFYRALLHQYAGTGEALVFEFYHGDRLIASRLTIHNQRTLVILKTTFLEDYKRYAVGRLLLYRVVEYLFQHKLVSRIAFYTNATPEQLEWATHSYPIYDISLYRHSIVGQAVRSLRRLRPAEIPAKESAKN